MPRAPCYHQRGSNGTAKCLLLREVISITEDRHPTLRQRDRQPPGYGQNRPLSVGATSFPGQPFVGAGGKHRLRHISLPSAYHRCSGCGPAGGVAALRELCPRRAWLAPASRDWPSHPGWPRIATRAPSPDLCPNPPLRVVRGRFGHAEPLPDAAAATHKQRHGGSGECEYAQHSPARAPRPQLCPVPSPAHCTRS